jgi:uncharacterized membrane protein YqgA involved in biofilm formation
VLVGLGTAINVVAVLVGGGIGTLVGVRLPESVRHTAMHAIGIVALLVGVSNFLELDENIHIESADLDTGSWAVRITVARRTKKA